MAFEKDLHPSSSEGGVLESQIDLLSVKKVEANHDWDDEKT